MATSDKAPPPPSDGPAVTRRAAGAAAACVPAAAGIGAASRCNFTVGRGDSGVAGLAAVTWTREVSFLGLGASAGRPMTEVSLFASSSGDTGGPGGGRFDGAGVGGVILGVALRPVKPGGRL